MKKSVFALFLLFAACFVLVNKVGVEAASIPPWPNIYSGNVLVDGAPPADGSLIVGKIGTYVSQPVTIKNGRYAGLAVGAPDSSFFGKAITFHLDDIVVASETDVFSLNEWIVVNSSFDLTFPAYPTPTPVPTSTPTNTPLPTATPDVPGPMVVSGVIELDYGSSADLLGENIVARVGSYFSDPTLIEENYGILIFEGLTLDPRDHKFIGLEITFIVSDLQAYGNSAVFESNGSVDLALRVAFPTPTAVPAIPADPAITAVPATAIPATATSVPATAVPATEVPTAEPTAVPIAAPVQVPPTAVPLAPVVVVVTATPEPEPDLTPVVEDAGGCNVPGPVTPITGAANALMLFAPLMLIGAYKGMKRRRGR